MHRSVVIGHNRSRHPHSGCKIERDYRWDVRGHERVRVRRGELPIEPADRANLLKRGYRVYTEGEMSVEDTERLCARGKRLRQDKEWVAVLTSWVDHYVKGPEDTPLIPAVRKMDSAIVQDPVFA